MLDINYILDNPQKVKDAAGSKGVSIDTTALNEKFAKYRDMSVEIQKLRAERNKSAKEIGSANPQNRQTLIDAATKLKAELDIKEEELKKLHLEIHPLIISIPNLPKDDVKVGKDESENDVIRKFKEPTKFSFKAKDHLTLGETLGIIDVERASKVSGSRFYYLKGDGVLLQFALRQLAFDLLLKEGFIPVLPPVLVKTETMRALGYMENGGDEDMYQLPQDNLIMVGTSEQSIVPMHKNETLNEKDLPIRYVGYSSCFRREAGSYGKDTRGILRAHQFEKIEMVSYVKEGEDDKEHDFMLALEEKLLQAIEVPYQVVKMCTGDLGFPAARKYDLEGWIPSELKYRELTSTSTTTDFQSRRLNIRYRDGDKTKFVNILNGTGFSTRPIIAILENNQLEDGSIKIPLALQKYMGKEFIK